MCVSRHTKNKILGWERRSVSLKSMFFVRLHKMESQLFWDEMRGGNRIAQKLEGYLTWTMQHTIRNRRDPASAKWKPPVLSLTPTLVHVPT